MPEYKKEMLKNGFYQNERKVFITFLLVTCIFALKFFGAVYTNSLALYSDSWHLLTDIASLLFSWWGLRQARKAATCRYTFGYYRHGVLTAFINNISLICVSVYIFYSAVQRYFHPANVEPGGMILIALCGLLFNCVIAFTLHRNTKNLTVKSVFHASYDPDGVAEFAVMLIQMALRHYKQALYRANANDYSLNGLLGKELRNLTVGVIGTGGIGGKVIRILQGFGCRVLAYNAHQTLPQALAGMAECCTLDRLYAESDVVTLHVPLTDATWHMINHTALQKMKDGVILVNCARGSLMSIEDIITGIETQKIGALGLDVIEDEEGIYHQDRRSDILINRNMAYIRQFPNVIMTQHMAFYTDVAVRSMAAGGIGNIVDFLLNKSSANEV